MALIKMDTDRVEAAILKLRESVNELDDQLQQLRRSKNRLANSWSGGERSSRFINKLERNIQDFKSSLSSLDQMEKRVSRELIEWMDADASFTEGTEARFRPAVMPKVHPGDIALSIPEIQGLVCGSMTGDALTRCESIWSHPPTDAEQLVYMVMNLPESQPILIMDIGNGEFLVLVRGTTSGIHDGSNWGSAFESMFGSSSYQNSVVDALNNAHLPEGARLHFAGHSQGGMISQNLAVDPRVTSKYSIESVSYFGSPDTMAAANPGVKYYGYEAPGDIVPHLDEVVRGIIPGGDLNPVSGAFRDVSHQSTKYTIVDNPDALNPNPWVSHAIYEKPGVLTGVEIPFNTSKWNAVSISGSKISTPGAWLYEMINTQGEEVARSIRDFKIL